ncbi:MAG: DNA polymerase III subunit delta [Pirellulaceae bacterium]|nr:DNA polymerase III subunit delta [Pirellulaceae bacterium]
MSSLVHALDYLLQPLTPSTNGETKGQISPREVNILFGDDSYLRHEAYRQFRRQALPDEEVPYGQYDGKTIDWRDIADELATNSLFGGHEARLVVVEQAEDFITKNRESLENYAKAPSQVGTLLLITSKWPTNTRLYKQLAKTGLMIECSAPTLTGRSKGIDEKKIISWLQKRIEIPHGAKLNKNGASELYQLIGPEFGLLDQALAKLALFSEGTKPVSPEIVQTVVGGWRTKTVWDLIDAATEGRTAEAIGQLERLLQAGEHPVALLGQLSWSLRRFATATRLFQEAEKKGRIPIRQALEGAGFRRWPQGALERAENQIKQLGRDRAGSLHRWLLEVDTALKRSHSTPTRGRFVLEQLILNMARRQKTPSPRR